MVLHPTHIGVATSASQAGAARLAEVRSAAAGSRSTTTRRTLKGSTEFNAMAIEAQMSQLRAVGQRCTTLR